MADPFTHWIEAQGFWAPWLFVALFVAASFLMIWRLEVMSARGFEGTVLGTLVMPYCSGMGNLIFAFILGTNDGSGADVMTNNLVNNVTDMTLVLGLPTIIWGIKILPSKGKNAGKRRPGAEKVQRLNRLSLLMTLVAILFFTGAVWALARKGSLNFNDGLVLIGLFLFWQCFHVFEVMKSDVRQGKSLIGWLIPLDIVLLAVGAYGIYVSTDWLVAWIQNRHMGFISARHLGWLTGWLMVLPNAHAGVLLRVERAARNGLYIAGRRLSYLHSVLSGRLYDVSHHGDAGVFSDGDVHSTGRDGAASILCHGIRPTAQIFWLDTDWRLRIFSLERVVGMRAARAAARALRSFFRHLSVTP